MSSSPSSQRGRLIVTTLFAFVVIGALLQIPRFTQNRSESPPPIAHEWPPDAPVRADFLSRLDTTAIDPSVTGIDFLRTVFAHRLSQPSHFDARARVVQTMHDGSTHQFGLETRAWWSGANGRVEVDAHRERGDTMWFAARTSDGQLIDLRWLNGPDDEAGSVVGPDLPIAFGDVPVSDPIALLEALRTGRFHAAGMDGDDLVVDIALVSGDTASAWRGRGRPDARGATALAWIGTSPRRVQSLYVFNAQDRLVRICDAFVVGENGTLESFTAESVAQRRRSVYHITGQSVTRD